MTSQLSKPETEMQPCPFCGKTRPSIGVILGFGQKLGAKFPVARVECVCGAHGSTVTEPATASRAVEAWNTRPAVPAQSVNEPVAWRWRPKGATAWIYNPEAAWLAEQDKVSTIECEPLYAGPPPPQDTRAQCVNRNAVIEECRQAAINAFLGFSRNDYVLEGPGGMGRRMANAILALKSSDGDSGADLKSVEGRETGPLGLRQPGNAKAKQPGPSEAFPPQERQDDCSCGGGDLSGHDPLCPYRREPQEVERLRVALRPFVTIRDQALSETMKLIQKDLDGFAPIAVTVTKDQFKAALSALSASPDNSQEAPAPQEREPGDVHPVLKHGDELHDLGFNAGWNAAIEECVRELETGYPDNANTNAFCAVIRALKRDHLSQEANDE